jgi:membrane protein YqaA with SNARE-associated domain
MLHRLYQRILGLSRHRHASYWLGAVSFIESSVFPIPPDVLLVPMALADRAKAFRYALVCTTTSVLGGLLGYAIGLWFWQAIGAGLIEFYGYQEEFQAFEGGFKEWGAWLVFVFGVTFFPYKVITIASGVAKLDPLIFILASILARSLRFYIEAGLIWKFGEPVQRFIEKRLALVITIVVFLVLLGFAAIKYLAN